MASSSSGNSVPAAEAVQVLVSSLADDSLIVREASMAALKEIAFLNPLLVLDCCLTVSRGGRRRFGNIAGLFQVMSVAIQALDKGDVDHNYLAKLAKIATSEVISTKELNADWQRAAAGVLVSIGSHMPDLVDHNIPNWSWKVIWKTKAAGKAACFGWTTAREACSTQNNLLRRVISLCNRCYLCENDQETVEHLLLHCSFSRQC